MTERYSFRNLIVWEKAQALAVTIIKLMSRIPQSWSNAVLVRQIVSSATSVGANIAEGHGRYSTGAHRNHLSIARGSAVETDSWLDILRRMSYITPDEEAALHDECNQIIAMLSSKMIKLDAELIKDRRIKEEIAHITSLPSKTIHRLPNRTT